MARLAPLTGPQTGDALRIGGSRQIACLARECPWHDLLVTDREDATYALVLAHWKWVDARNADVEPRGIRTAEALFEVVKGMRIVGVEPDEVLRAIRRWLVEDDEISGQMGQYWLVMWENAVEDERLGHVQ